MPALVSMLYFMALGIPAMLFHESGHIVTAMLCGVQVKKVGLSRTGLYTVREAGPRWANLCISLAGPLANLSLAVALRHVLPVFALVNLIACLYNLLPIPNSDGKRILALLHSDRAITAEAKPQPLQRNPA